MRRKKDFPTLSGWNDEGYSSKEDRGNKNYELEFLRLENQKLKQELMMFEKNKKVDMTMEKDIAALLQVSMRMKSLLEAVRQEVMIPMELGRHIDKVIKEIENYG
jgi:hypothetical protein